MPSIIDNNLVDGGINGVEIVDTEANQVNIEFTLKYHIQADNIDQRENDILATPGLPPAMFFLRGAYAIRRSAQEVSGIGLLWTAEIAFSSNIPDPAFDPSTEPDAQVAKVSWDAEEIDELSEFDAVEGIPIQNAVEQPLFVTAPIVLPVLNIRRWERYPFDPNKFLDFANTVNEDAFIGAPRGCALMKPMNAAEPQNIGNTLFTEVTYRIVFRLKVVTAVVAVGQGGELEVGQVIKENGWRMNLLNQGTKKRKEAGGAIIVATDNDDDTNAATGLPEPKGNPIEVNLEADGTVTPEGQPRIYIPFNRYRYSQFDDLELLGVRFPV